MPVRVALPETLSQATLDGVLRAVSSADGGALVLHGVCRGMDLDAWLDGGSVEPGLRRFADLIVALRAAKRPTIAVVDGAMMGGGVGVAGACDVVLASPRSTFALPEALFGLLPGVVVPALSHRMSAHSIALLASTGTARDAEWARGAGLVDEVTENLERAETRWARALSRVAGERLADLREWTRAAGAMELGAAAARGAEHTARVASDPRVREGARAFLRDGEAPWQR